MVFLIVKYLVTSLIIVVVSEVAKRTDKVGALIASLPFVTVMTMIWLWYEQQDTAKIANHAWYTFWYVIPTIPMFLVMPWLLYRGVNFWLTLMIGVLFTVLCFLGTALVARKFGVQLFP